MKHLFIYALASLFAASCSNQTSTEAGKTDAPAEAVVSDEQISNPATAENPTATPSEYAVMTFKTTEHNFGDILENQKVETTYEFTNTGKVDLLINDCRAACGCTVPDWPKTPIKPGASGKIKVVFDSAGKAGMNNKIVTVVANIKEGTLELKFTANVRAIKTTEQ
jgi:hypothetical protein